MDGGNESQCPHHAPTPLPATGSREYFGSGLCRRCSGDASSVRALAQQTARAKREDQEDGDESDGRAVGRRQRQE
jgi:hypothetical protein